jgi:hypothetical protein
LLFVLELKMVESTNGIELSLARDSRQ